MSEIASHTESANGIVKNSPAKSIDHLQKGVVEDMNHDEDCDNDDDEEEEEGAYEIDGDDEDEDGNIDDDDEDDNIDYEGVQEGEDEEGDFDKDAGDLAGNSSGYDQNRGSLTHLLLANPDEDEDEDEQEEGEGDEDGDAYLHGISPPGPISRKRSHQDSELAEDEDEQITKKAKA